MWSKEDQYRNGTFLAPMVRIGTLPMRLLALEYGADLVYTEELVDLKILRSTRQENKALGTVDFVDRTDGTVVFRTCEKEKDRVIFQMGTADPVLAYEVAKLVENDVAGIDVNMGCPKEFSVKGGMGVALLQDPTRACAILKRLTSANLKVPVTCKVRILNDEDKTVELLKSFEACGIQAVAVHGRTKYERQQHPNRNDCLRRIAESLKIPVIANGGSKEITCYEDISRFKEKTGCSSVMIARAAEWNASIFQESTGPPLPLNDVIRSYIRKAIEYDNPPANTKYCIQNMLRELQTTPFGRKFLETQTLAQISKLWDLGDYFQEITQKHRSHGLMGRWGVVPLTYDKESSCGSTIEMEAAFIRNIFPENADLPKTKLLAHLRSIGSHRLPNYKTIHADKLFKSVVTVGGVSYSSTFWEKNRRWAEQGAAIVCLCSLGVLDKEFLLKQGVLR